MLGSLIRYAVILVILALWVIGTFWAVSSVLRIHRVGNVDTAVAVRLVRKTLFKNPFAKFSEMVSERADLALSLTALKGITLAPVVGEVISAEYLQDRRQYLLAVRNPSKDPFSDINLRLQFPYPVETYQISDQHGADDVTFRAAPMMTMNVFGGGQIRVQRQPLTRDCGLQIAQLRPKGQVDILLVLNSWRDPRGKTIPPHEGARYSVPDVGPEITYIFGSFNLAAAGETIERDYYAPLLLNDDKTVTLGPPRPRPKNLVEETDIE